MLYVSAYTCAANEHTCAAVVLLPRLRSRAGAGRIAVTPRQSPPDEKQLLRNCVQSTGMALRWKLDPLERTYVARACGVSEMRRSRRGRVQVDGNGHGERESIDEMKKIAWNASTWHAPRWIGAGDAPTNTDGGRLFSSRRY